MTDRQTCAACGITHARVQTVAGRAFCVPFCVPQTPARTEYLDTCRAAQRDGATITHAEGCGFPRAVCACWPRITPAQPTESEYRARWWRAAATAAHAACVALIDLDGTEARELLSLAAQVRERAAAMAASYPEDNDPNGRSPFSRAQDSGR